MGATVPSGHSECQQEPRPRPRVTGEARAGRSGQRPSGQSTGGDIGDGRQTALLHHSETWLLRGAWLAELRFHSDSQQDFCKQGPEWCPGGESVLGRDSQHGRGEQQDRPVGCPHFLCWAFD